MKTMRIMKKLRELSKRCLTSMLLAGLLVLSAAAGLSACSSSLVSDVNLSNCNEMVPYKTRTSTESGILQMMPDTTDSDIIPHVLKITRDGNALYCTLHNARVNCGYSDVTVDCKRDGHRLNITYNSKVTGDDITNCLCYVTLYFAIRDMADDKFSIKVGKNGKEIPVDLSGHDYVMIDCSSGNSSYDEVILNPKVHSFKFEPYPDEGQISTEEAAVLQKKLVIYLFPTLRGIEFEFPKYLLPIDTKNLNVEVQTDDSNGSLVMSVSNDGKNYDTLKSYYGKIWLINAKKKFHLKLNPHKSTVSDADGAPHEETAYDYEGDIDFDNSNPITINY